MKDKRNRPLKHGSRWTLPVSLEVLKAAEKPLRVKEIIERAGPKLNTLSIEPYKVVARDLAMDIKWNGDRSLVIRVESGLFTARV